jgi:hypothetical protein
VTGNDIDDYLVRNAADGSVEFRIAAAVVRGISVEAMRGFGVTRRRGTEVGGLLLGAATKGIFVIDDFEVVPCEYAYGPSYLLSESDTIRFAQAVDQYRPAPGVDQYVVGWFRSHTRDGLQPDAPDLEIAHTHFTGIPSALLLIKPFASRKPEAAIFVPSNGKLLTEPSAEFTFAAPEPPEPPPAEPIAPKPARARVMGVSPPPHPPVQEPAQASTRAPAGPSMPPRARPEPAKVEQRAASTPPSSENARLLRRVLGSRDTAAVTDPRPIPSERDLFADYGPKPVNGLRRALAWSLFILAAVLFTYAGGYRHAGGDLAALLTRTPATPAVDPYALGLTARLRGDLVVIEWDRRAAPIDNAVGANLIIATADGRDEFRLAMSELRNGQVLYRSPAAEADIRLEVLLKANRRIAEQTTWTRTQLPQQ